MATRQANRKHRATWYVKDRTDKWWDNMISGRLPEDNWKKNFRMSREKFEQLVSEPNPRIAPDSRLTPLCYFIDEESWHYPLLFERHWLTFNDCQYIWY